MDTQSILLVTAAFFSSALSGVLGMGGGMLLLAVMASCFPPAVLIPLHGAVQLVSNSARAAMGWRTLCWRILGPMTTGSIAGAALGSQLALNLPETGYQNVMGLFILVITWAPMPRRAPNIRGKFFWLGGVSTALSMVVGATGPLIAPFFLREKLSKESIIATKAGGQAVTHLLKVGIFSLFGFQLSNYWLVFLGMLAAATLGTACGQWLLGRISERVFLILFKGSITLLASRMLLNGLID